MSFFELPLLLLAKLYREFAYIMNDVYSLLLPRSLSLSLSPHKSAIQSKQPVDQASTATSRPRPALMVKSLVLLTTHPSLHSHVRAIMAAGQRRRWQFRGRATQCKRAGTHSHTLFLGLFIFAGSPHSRRVCVTVPSHSLTQQRVWSPICCLTLPLRWESTWGRLAGFFSRDRLCPFVFFLSLTLTRAHAGISRCRVLL